MRRSRGRRPPPLPAAAAGAWAPRAARTAAGGSRGRGAVALPGAGREYLVTVARRDIIESYERVCEAAGVHAGLIDIASFNQINAVLARGLVSGDWLVGEGAAAY